MVGRHLDWCVYIGRCAAQAFKSFLSPALPYNVCITMDHMDRLRDMSQYPHKPTNVIRGSTESVAFEHCHPTIVFQIDPKQNTASTHTIINSCLVNIEFLLTHSPESHQCHQFRKRKWKLHPARCIFLESPLSKWIFTFHFLSPI